mgnify:CR=1 FL=1
MYKVRGNNIYTMKRLIREFIKELSEKYIPNNLTKFFDINFSLDNHLAERLLERNINKKDFESLVTGLIRDHLCEVIYLSLAYKRTRININNKNGLLLGVTGTHYEDGNFIIKLHTCFTPNNRDGSKALINTKNIYI